MPGGRRNPVQMSQLIGTLHNALSRAKDEAKDAKAAAAGALGLSHEDEEKTWRKGDHME